MFLLATATIWPFSAWSGNAVSVTVLVALLVCLIPTTIGGLLSAIGVAGMSRMLGANVIATSGRAVEAAGDVDVLLLDKTGTITPRQPSGLGFSCRLAASKSAYWPTPPNCRRWRMKRRKAAASWCWRNSAFNLRERDPAVAARHICPLYRPDPYERYQHRPTHDPQRVGGRDSPPYRS